MALDRKVIEKAFFGIASLVGLCFAMIGAVGLLMLALNIALKVPQYPLRDAPPTPADYIGELRERPELTGEQKQAVGEWSRDFNDWQDKKIAYDKNIYRRRELATHLSFILVGTPIFLFFKSKFSRA